ncbi:MULTISPECIES: helix-turn-helix domain-containing protein [Chryseobacterium]|uniref:Helix-turn-helix n=2 Tax=Chryseobacterium TaxID=59732 RepID=A0A239WGM1_9FLAO|nr:MULTISPECIES: helix-turn-helix transcriptional regulator [Chryseobacterium]AZI20419.1 XRE family transcriptional regulator [Chryseobacterium taklimakanense]AZI22724.1 XRE family transcriptional regulator [Chryseobacterium taklimakanense]MBF5027578.1 helix-turn-helix transcriptional regulator [Planobacterium oryzisoli]MCG7280503.1 helix-turn-helix transcriptional regulator [Chryseobacterium taklimakanense]SNV32754.1 Helix-turn-helix [Chryseobacterium taklimakanense]
MKSKIFKKILDETPLETKIFVEKYSDLIIRINQILRDKGISQKELAEGMDKKPAEISRWLSGNQNITLKSIAKLEAELGEPIIEIPVKRFSACFKDEWEKLEVSFTVERRKETYSKDTQWLNEEKVRYA